MCRLGLGLIRHIVGRLGLGMRVSFTFQIICRPVSRLELGSGPNVVGRLGSGPRVRAVGYLRGGVFSVGGVVCWGELSPGGLSLRIGQWMSSN